MRRYPRRRSPAKGSEFPPSRDGQESACAGSKRRPGNAAHEDGTFRGARSLNGEHVVIRCGPSALKTIRQISAVATAPTGTVKVATRDDLHHIRHWRHAFLNQRKDHRYYDIVERTVEPQFAHRFFIIEDTQSGTRTTQPFFLLDQDLLGGIPSLAPAVKFVRRWWPGFMQIRTLMIGCAAGEGHLDGATPMGGRASEILANAIREHAAETGARLIVMKEFPAEYRTSLGCFVDHGFTRVPSLPMVVLDIDYADFDDYMQRGLHGKMRSHLRRKFRDAAKSEPIEMSVVSDVTPIIDDIYPLYLQVYERATLRFEKLTKEYFCEVGRRMPDKARFFIWRQSGKPVAFSLSLVHGDAIYNEYLGLDYAVALDLHLYFYAFRDVMSWAIANGYKRYLSTGLSYDPKLHLRFRLFPLDLYVRHTSRAWNVLLKWLLPLIEPTRYDKTLREFPNYAELHGENPGRSVPAAAKKEAYPRASSTARSEILDHGATRSRKAM